MFQSYDDPGEGSATRERLANLRALLQRAKLDAFLVPRADEHQGEYVPPCAERLAWISGFTGSAGSAAIAMKSAALFVDGRYTVQAPAQVDRDSYRILQVPDHKMKDWLIENLPRGAKVGFDPCLHFIHEVEQLHRALAPKGIALKGVARNLIDRVWGATRPAAPTAAVTVHAVEFAGESAEGKIAKLQQTLKAAGQSAVILTLPDSICWLLNIRGADVAHNPVVLAFALVPSSGKVELFINPDKITPETGAYLRPIAKLRPPADLAKRIDAFKTAKKRVRLDPATAPWWFYHKLGGRLGDNLTGSGAKLVARGPDPCLLPKAIKNAVEIEGSRTAHKRDGIAVVQFLAWLDAAAVSGSHDLNEINAAQKLEDFRQQSGALKDISFDTISGSGSNGAIVHYRVTKASNRRLRAGELYLVDSGAQYFDATTDITRTIAIGKPTKEMRRRFTLVLQGHINIATARFPKGTRGVDLDSFARRALWDHGLDFDHGTGHGVGSYLSVHEGPQGISRRATVALKPGMILSNEPGFYKTGAYGIRLENLVLVSPLGKISGGEREMMSFETLTLAPFDGRLIDSKLMTQAELDWLNSYHAHVAKALKSGLDKATRKWLLDATKPIK